MVLGHITSWTSPPPSATLDTYLLDNHPRSDTPWDIIIPQGHNILPCKIRLTQDSNIYVQGICPDTIKVQLVVAAEADPIKGGLVLWLLRQILTRGNTIKARVHFRCWGRLKQKGKTIYNVPVSMGSIASRWPAFSQTKQQKTRRPICYLEDCRLIGAHLQAYPQPSRHSAHPQQGQSPKARTVVSCRPNPCFTPTIKGALSSWRALLIFFSRPSTGILFFRSGGRTCRAGWRVETVSTFSAAPRWRGTWGAVKWQLMCPSPFCGGEADHTSTTVRRSCLLVKKIPGVSRTRT